MECRPFSGHSGLNPAGRRGQQSWHKTDVLHGKLIRGKEMMGAVNVTGSTITNERILGAISEGLTRLLEVERPTFTLG